MWCVLMLLTDLEGRHAGEDVWVLGSGASMNFLNPRFFDDKVVVATNLAAHGFGVISDRVYVHSHYHENVQFQLRPDWVFVTPRGDRGFAGSPTFEAENVVFYEHQPTGNAFDVEAMWHESGLVVGSSSIHGSMHLAAYMGARNVILVGADCGLVDGESNYSGYLDERGNSKSGDLIENDQLKWFARWDRDLVQVKQKLISVYGCGVYSLNPFVNYNLEGHSFTGADYGI